jgi:hypothetical protein
VGSSVIPSMDPGLIAIRQMGLLRVRIQRSPVNSSLRSSAPRMPFFCQERSVIYIRIRTLERR